MANSMQQEVDIRNVVFPGVATFVQKTMLAVTTVGLYMGTGLTVCLTINLSPCIYACNSTTTVVLRKTTF